MSQVEMGIPGSWGGAAVQLQPEGPAKQQLLML